MYLVNLIISVILIRIKSWNDDNINIDGDGILKVYLYSVQARRRPRGSRGSDPLSLHQDDSWDSRISGAIEVVCIGGALHLYPVLSLNAVLFYLLLQPAAESSHSTAVNCCAASPILTVSNGLTDSDPRDGPCPQAFSSRTGYLCLGTMIWPRNVTVHHGKTAFEAFIIAAYGLMTAVSVVSVV